MDKEFLRRYLKEVGYDGEGPIPRVPDETRVEASRRYLEGVELITGLRFEPNLEEPVARMEASVAAYLAGQAAPASAMTLR